MGDAERLAVALKLGKLSVSVRSASVPSAASKPAQPITWAGDVSRSITGEQNVPETTSLFIYRGAQTAVTRF